MVPVHLLGAQLSAAMIVSRAPEARDCPATEQLIAKVERIVGRSLAAPAGAPSELFLRADFSRVSGHYEARVQLTGAREGERVLRDEGSSCDALADALALTIALLLDESGRTQAAAAGVPAETGPAWLQWWASGRFGAGVGLGGGPTWVAGAGIGASLGPLTSIQLGATLAGSQTHPLGAGRVEVRLWYLELGGFRSLTGERVQVGPSLQLMGGVLRGGGEGYPFSSSASLPWFAVGAGLRAEIKVGSSLMLGARVLALVPIRKQSFSIGYVGTAYESSSMAGVVECVLGIKFW